jgi:beta-glucanase (GH16 family)
MFFGTVHNWTAVNGVRTSTQNQPNYLSLGLANDYTQWHKYGLLWQSGSITWYYDDNPILTAPEPSIMNTQDVELILDMAEGVNWMPGTTTGVTAPDLRLNVDWVSVWQHNPSVTTISTNRIAFRGN